VKLILSRKGFDSSSGGVANPILPDGRMIALPIPDAHSPICYDAIDSPIGALGPLVEDLTRGRVQAGHGAHLDPDLDPAARPRHPDWRPLFGQAGAAQGHLNKHGVGPGDLFLFFGWFREIARIDGRWRFLRDSPDRHVLYGWFQIGEILDLTETLPPASDWRHDHPHCHGERGRNNRLYVAAKTVECRGLSPTVPGAGLFPEYRESLVLTWPGHSRAIWRLPPWFHPEGRRSNLSYHDNPDRWSRVGDSVRLDAVKRGQELVLDTDDYPEAIDWAASLIDVSRPRRYNKP